MNKLSRPEIYDFNAEDVEDSIVRNKNGAFATGTDRRGAWFSLVLLIIAFGGLFFVLRLVDDVFVEGLLLAPLALLSVPWLARKQVQGRHPVEKSIRAFLVLGQAYRFFVLNRFVSFCAALAAVPLVVAGPKEKLLPLRPVALVFGCAFIFFMWLVMRLDQFGLGLFLEHSETWLRLKHTLQFKKAWLPFVSSFDTVYARFVAGVVAVLGFMVFTITTMTLAAWLVSWAVVFALGFFSREIVRDDDIVEPSLHLSDLHITQPGTESIEKSLVDDRRLRHRIVKLLLATDKPVVISGDITDSGQRGEWLILLKILRTVARLKSSQRPAVILAPGNHDIFPYMDEFRPYRSSLPLTSRLVRLRKIRYLEAVLRVCPEMHVLVDGKEKALRDHLKEHAGIIDAVARKASLDVLPIDDLWASCFPMYCIVGLQAYVCIDTNRPTSNFLTSAFGTMETAQYRRLADLLQCLNSRPRLKIVMVGHHHLFTPLHSRICDLNIKHLEMLGGKNVPKLAGYAADYYLHGHRHVPFRFKLNRVAVISAESLRFPFDNEQSKCVKVLIYRIKQWVLVKRLKALLPHCGKA